MTVSNSDFDSLHQKVDKNSEALARIEGKIDGIREQKANTASLVGIISAIALGVWNLIK